MKIFDDVKMVIVLSLFTQSCTHLEASEKLIPVHWCNKGDLSRLRSLKDVETERLRPLRPNGEQGLKMGDQIAQNCKEYDEFKKQGLEVGVTTFDLTQESFFKQKCTLLQLIKKAQPSKKSFLSHYKFTKNSLRDFPPSLGGIWGEPSRLSSLREAMKAGKSWADFDPKKKVTQITKNSITFADRNEKVFLEFLVWGDFNHDGVEDVWVKVATHAIEGSFRSYDHAILTRRKHENQFRVIQLDP
jgi:hypothetical protein